MRRVALAALIACAGCAPVGRDFIRPTPVTAELGKATPQDVRARFGEPRSERSWARGDLELAKEVGSPFGALPRVPGSMTELYYYFSSRAAPATAPGVEPSRSAHYWFWNGRLVGFRSSSSFKSDSTDFDSARASAFKPWQTLRAELIAALGEPSGVRIYPLTPGEDLQMLTWFNFEWDTAQGQQRSRTLHALVNGIGVVVDLRFASDAKPLPPSPTPAYAPVPIYIPPARKK
jgi:hypothetical protein